jgi:hypothetical protein
MELKITFKIYRGKLNYISIEGDTYQTGECMHKKIVVVLWTILNTYASADTLTVFRSNTPAKAAEVNANFALLAARIDSLKAIAALRDSVAVLRTKIKTDSAALAAADSANQLALGSVAAFFIEPGADGYLPGSHSTWLLAAGQGVINGVQVPDMRGCFLRGIDFTVTGHPPTGLDPDGVRKPGSKQEDAFQWHTHITAIQTSVSNGSGGGYSVAFDRQLTWAATYPTSGPYNNADSVNNQLRTAYETRPKNIAVFWYVKVK